MTGWKNGRISATARILENLPWEESEGLPAEAAREPQAQRPRPGGCKAAGSWEKRVGAASAAGSRRHQGVTSCFSAPRPPAEPDLFLPPSTGSVFRHKGPEVRATIWAGGPAVGQLVDRELEVLAGGHLA